MLFVLVAKAVKLLKSLFAESQGRPVAFAYTCLQLLSPLNFKCLSKCGKAGEVGSFLHYGNSYLPVRDRYKIIFFFSLSHFRLTLIQYLKPKYLVDAFNCIFFCNPITSVAGTGCPQTNSGVFFSFSFFLKRKELSSQCSAILLWSSCIYSDRGTTASQVDLLFLFLQIIDIVQNNPYNIGCFLSLNTCFQAAGQSFRKKKLLKKCLQCAYHVMGSFLVIIFSKNKINK